MRGLLLSGGVGHPFEATSATLAALLGEAGIATDVTTDIEAGLLALGEYELLVVNALRWRMQADKYAPLRDEWAFELSPHGRAAIADHVDAGRGVLAVHTAAICFDDWPRWGEIVGGAWSWERSSHPPIDGVEVSVHTGAHPLVDGVEDFTIVDEVYSFMDLQPDVHPLASSHSGGEQQPLLWARTVGRARVVYDALGHDERSYAQPEHRRILRRCGMWVAGAPDAEVAAA